jgi:hypothetical protein
VARRGVQRTSGRRRKSSIPAGAVGERGNNALSGDFQELVAESSERVVLVGAAERFDNGGVDFGRSEGVAGRRCARSASVPRVILLAGKGRRVCTVLDCHALTLGDATLTSAAANNWLVVITPPPVNWPNPPSQVGTLAVSTVAALQPVDLWTAGGGHRRGAEESLATARGSQLHRLSNKPADQ